MDKFVVTSDKGPANSTHELFENLHKELLTPAEAAQLLNRSVKTIYDWRYRGWSYGVPKELFLKINRRLVLRTNVLRRWIASQNVR